MVDVNGHPYMIASRTSTTTDTMLHMASIGVGGTDAPADGRRSSPWRQQRPRAASMTRRPLRLTEGGGEPIGPQVTPLTICIG